MVAEDKGRRAVAIDKQYQSAEAKANKSEREAEELILNLKSRAEEERIFLRNPASGKHHRREGGRKTRRRVGSGRCRFPGAMISDDERRDGNASDVVSIIPPGVGTSIYKGLERRRTGGGMERGGGID